MKRHAAALVAAALTLALSSVAYAAAAIGPRVGGAQDSRRGQPSTDFPVSSVSPWSSSDRLVVSPEGPYVTIEAALDDARDGDAIEVRSGAHAGPIVVGKSVTLEGVDWPVIDGGGQGTVVTLAAPGVVFRGFEVRGSGAEPDRDHSGIALAAPGILVENNRLRDVLFGIFVAQADDAIVRGNDISSKQELDEGRKGDAIRVWYSQRATIERNHAHQARDVVMWYSSDSIVRDNLFERGRYGVHLMYCNRVVIERNRVLDNSVGIFTMYSKDTVLRDNLIRGQRGPSGYALGFKDADNVETVNNVVVDNRVGLFVDGTPYTPSAFARYERNVLAFNDVGVLLQPSVQHNHFDGNTLWENVEQVSVQGGGQLLGNEWQGNYWSDYAGFDADGDGAGDVPYRSERLFDGLIDREPRLRALIYSPAVQAIELAAMAFPIVKPQPKLTDAAPLSQPAAIPDFAVPPPGNTAGMTLAATLMLAVGAICGGFVRRRSRGDDLTRRRLAATDVVTAAGGFRNGARAMSGAEKLIVVSDVIKQYGKVNALDKVSFEAGPGQAIALWGPNGAGKTTLLKAILGLVDFQGDVRVAGFSARRQGKRARGYIGYVPQEVVFYDWRVLDTMAFYARLKKVDAARIPALLERLALTDHARKSVSALSGGLKQRLALAVALLADPPLLLLDEPTASLDAQARRDYLSLLASLRRDGKTIVFASHRLEEIEALADRVIVVEHGRVVEALTPEDLRAKYLSQHDMTLWVPEAQRVMALQCLEGEGLSAHLNGRGTLVVRVADAQKMTPLELLGARGVRILNFELERVQTWN